MFYPRHGVAAPQAIAVRILAYDSLGQTSVKRISIGTWIDPEPPLEGAAKRIITVKSHRRGDSFNGLRALGEPAASFLEPKILHKSSRRAAKCRFESSGKMPWRKARPFCQGL